MRFTLTCLLLLSTTAVATADSLWDHNGSVMHLQQDGEKRFMYYAQPRDGMLEAGVTPGTLFFDGVREGDALIGTARVFSSKCAAPMTFSISGPIYNDGRIVLEGMRPVFKNCQATGQMKLDRLEFSFIKNFAPEIEEGSAQLSSELDGAGNSTANVPTEAERINNATDSANKAELGALMKAGLEGDPAAYRKLSRIFAEGDGVAPSAQRSKNFLRKAGELGDYQARFEWSKAVLESNEASEADIALATAWKNGKELAKVAGNDNASTTQSKADKPCITCELEFWVSNRTQDEIMAAINAMPDVNVRHKDGWTTIAAAASARNLEVVKLLLERGADPNAVDDFGYTPIYAAINSGEYEILKLLVQAGAKIDHVSNDGLSVLEFAEEKRNTEIVEFLKSLSSKVETASNSTVELEFALSCKRIEPLSQEQAAEVYEIFIGTERLAMPTNIGESYSTAEVKSYPELGEKSYEAFVMAVDNLDFSFGATVSVRERTISLMRDLSALDGKWWGGNLGPIEIDRRTGVWAAKYGSDYICDPITSGQGRFLYWQKKMQRHIEDIVNLARAKNAELDAVVNKF